MGFIAFAIRIGHKHIGFIAFAMRINKNTLVLLRLPSGSVKPKIFIASAIRINKEAMVLLRLQFV